MKELELLREKDLQLSKQLLRMESKFKQIKERLILKEEDSKHIEHSLVLGLTSLKKVLIQNQKIRSDPIQFT